MHTRYVSILQWHSMIVYLFPEVSLLSLQFSDALLQQLVNGRIMHRLLGDVDKRGGED